MKKRILLILILLIVFSSFVSAGIFSGVWQEYFTGKQVEEVQETPHLDAVQTKQQMSEAQGLAFKKIMKLYGDNLKCSDSDNGLNFEEVGSTKIYIDENLFDRIIHWFSLIFGNISTKEINSVLRPEGYGDRCVDVAYASTSGVKENFENFDFNEKVQIFGDNYWLEEYYCEGQKLTPKYYQCPNGCNSGRCLTIPEKNTIKPQRDIYWNMFSNQGENEPGMILNERIASVKFRKNVPQGIIFIKNQEEFNSLFTDNSMPEFYTKYPVFTLTDIETNTGAITLKIEKGWNEGRIKLKLGEKSDIILNDENINIRITNLDFSYERSSDPVYYKNVDALVLFEYLGLMETVNIEERNKKLGIIMGPS